MRIHKQVKLRPNQRKFPGIDVTWFLGVNIKKYCSFLIGLKIY